MFIYIPPVKVSSEVFGKLMESNTVLKLYDIQDYSHRSNMDLALVKEMDGFPIIFITRMEAIYLDSVVESERDTIIYTSDSRYRKGIEITLKYEIYEHKAEVNFNLGEIEVNEELEYTTKQWHGDIENEALSKEFQDLNKKSKDKLNTWKPEHGKYICDYLDRLSFIRGKVDFRTLHNVIAERYTGAEL